MSYITTGVKFVNEVHHPCGCVTAFDVVAWHSVARFRCREHDTMVAIWESDTENDYQFKEYFFWDEAKQEIEGSGI